MNDNTWKLREIIRKLEQVQSDLNRITSTLEQHLDQGQVSDELLRSLTSPTEDLEWRVEGIRSTISA